MKTERVVTKNRDEASISRIIQSFIGLGWVYDGFQSMGTAISSDLTGIKRLRQFIRKAIRLERFVIERFPARLLNT